MLLRKNTIPRTNRLDERIGPDTTQALPPCVRDPYSRAVVKPLRIAQVPEHQEPHSNYNDREIFP